MVLNTFKQLILLCFSLPPVIQKCGEPLMMHHLEKNYVTKWNLFHFESEIAFIGVIVISQHMTRKRLIHEY